MKKQLTLHKIERDIDPNDLNDPTNKSIIDDGEKISPDSKLVKAGAHSNQQKALAQANRKTAMTEGIKKHMSKLVES